jgi:hypothetical protein
MRSGIIHRTYAQKSLVGESGVIRPMAARFRPIVGSPTKLSLIFPWGINDGQQH